MARCAFCAANRLLSRARQALFYCPLIETNLLSNYADSRFSHVDRSVFSGSAHADTSCLNEISWETWVREQILFIFAVQSPLPEVLLIRKNNGVFILKVNLELNTLDASYSTE